ncbi:MAG: hypothetical protein J6X86_06010 [Bacteroidales bacterium]|nr:hypothetical protein [Bacteroidales bacterium]
MKLKKVFYSLILTAFSLSVAVACNPSSQTKSETNDSIVKTDVENHYVGEFPQNDETLTNVKESSTTEEEKSQPAKKTTNQNYGSAKETLYISTYGANGKVWGHVTMNGKTGRGTIHDEDENSYTITVTRHGGELYGTDQNGRQYVFRM